MHYGINRSVKMKRKVLTRYLLFHLLKAYLARDLYSLSLDAIPVSLEVVRPHEQLTAKLAFVGGREMVFTVFTESRWISKTLCALVALVRLSPSVRVDVARQSLLLCESFLAEITLVRFNLVVYSQDVALQ